jgi:hypothetical protein
VKSVTAFTRQTEFIVRLPFRLQLLFCTLKFERYAFITPALQRLGPYHGLQYGYCLKSGKPEKTQIPAGAPIIPFRAFTQHAGAKKKNIPPPAYPASGGVLDIFAEHGKR